MLNFLGNLRKNSSAYPASIPTSAADRDDADQCRRWANVAMLAG